MKFKLLTAILLVWLLSSAYAPEKGSYKIGLLKYNGGGDWYANLDTSLPNLIKFCNKNLKTNIGDQETIEVSSKEIYNYPFIHLTGHGNVFFSVDEANNLRNYLLAGGFLHISDNYGMDKFIRTEMKKVFPELEFIELPFTHPIYHQKYDFDNGLPKVHEHDEKPAQGFGLIYEGRLLCFYDFECDLGDGWEDQSIHNDSDGTRTKALQMGANIIQYALTSE